MLVEHHGGLERRRRLVGWPAPWSAGLASRPACACDTVVRLTALAWPVEVDVEVGSLGGG